MDSNNSASPKVDVYQIVTSRIIELLEQGTVPWQQPWTTSGIPSNAISKRSYRGINLWLLLSLNYERNIFLTWDQLKKIGASVKAGEHGHVVIYWKVPPKNQDVIDGEREKKKPILRYYKVFNVAQCTGLPESFNAPFGITEHDAILECEAVIASMPQCPAIKYQEQRAFYEKDKDYINMPKKKFFKTKESFYATLFHELVHSTGSEKRLNRKTITDMYEFGSEAYSLEELIAEMGSAYLLSYTGILATEIGNSAAYIKGWLTQLKNDKRFIVQASGQAQRAVDFIINKPDTADASTEETVHNDVIPSEN